MSQSDEQPPSVFQVAFKTSDPTSFFAQQLTELRADIGALAVIVLRDIAERTGEPLEVAKRYEDARKTLLLEMMFQFQDQHAEKPDPPDSDA